MNSFLKSNYFILILGFIVVWIYGMLVMRYWITPIVLRIPDDFTYNANIVSLDNFYDETIGGFVGEKQSVTNFAYQRLSGSNPARIRNSFDVRTITGDEIISIHRDYLINSQSWKHITTHAQPQRSGYLFAPRYALQGTPYTYWHVNYNQPITLTFSHVETLHGLRTYKYSASFLEDQTDSLHHLPGVPESRGVNLDVSLDVWIEPVSGWLVQYQDSAIAYYYDQSSKKRIHPWNKYKNTMARSSIQSHVHRAHTRKLLAISLDYIFPFILSAGSAAWVLRDKKRLAGSIILVSILVSSSYYLYDWIRMRQYDPIVIGISRFVPTENQIYNDNIQGFKDALEQAGYTEGTGVEYIERSAQGDTNALRRIAQEFIQHDVDLVYSLTTTGTLVLQEEIPHKPIVFSIVTYPVESGLISSLQQSNNNLVGTRNWIPANEQLAIFLDMYPSAHRIGFLHREGESNSVNQLEEMIEAARSKNIEIVSISGSTKAELLQNLNEKIPTIDVVYSACDTLIQGEAEEDIIALLQQERKVSFTCNHSGVTKGDLIGSVANFYEIGKQSGEKATLILDGATPSSLQTTTASRPYIYVNKLRADQLNIAIPQTIINTADEIIE